MRGCNPDGPVAYRWPLFRQVAQTVHDLGEDGFTPDLAALFRAVEDVSVKDAAVGLAARIDLETDRDRDRSAGGPQRLVRSQWHEDRRYPDVDADVPGRQPHALHGVVHGIEQPVGLGFERDHGLERRPGCGRDGDADRGRQ